MQGQESSLPFLFIKKQSFFFSLLCVLPNLIRLEIITSLSSIFGLGYWISLFQSWFVKIFVIWSLTGELTCLSQKSSVVGFVELSLSSCHIQRLDQLVCSIHESAFVLHVENLNKVSSLLIFNANSLMWMWFDWSHLFFEAAGRGTGNRFKCRNIMTSLKLAKIDCSHGLFSRACLWFHGNIL